MSQPRLQVHNLHASHGTQDVLHGISLACDAGQWLAVVGPNGAGKSSLLRCMAGLMPSARGQVHLEGKELTAWSSLAKARHLSWLSQTVPDDNPMTVVDTVSLGRLPYQGWMGLAALSAKDHHAVQQALQDTDTLALSHRRMDSLSGGERQRVCLARALAVQSSVLLLDEPAAHLDAPHQRLLAQVLRREALRGCAVISVVHELSMALSADAIAVLRQGVLVAHGLRDDPQVHRAMEEVFDQSIEIVKVHERWVAVPQL